MPLLNNNQKSRIAYLASLSLLFSYVELLLPKILPFFKLGLGNVIVLLSLDLPFRAFLLLNLLKILSNALLSGTLFTPFLLISFVQGFFSAIFMFLLKKISVKTKLLSIYGISMAGSALSAILQIALSSLYLGIQSMGLLGPMLFFSIFSALITAFLSLHLQIPNTVPEIIWTDCHKEQEEINLQDEKKEKKKLLFISLALILSIAFVMLFKNLKFLILALIAALSFQKACKRRILILPHLSLLFFVLLCSLFSPSGKVLFKIFNFSVTQGALIDGLKKALKLSVVSSISQGASSLRFTFSKENSIAYYINLSLYYFDGFFKSIQKYKTNLIKGVKESLKLQVLEVNKREVRGINLTKAILLFVFYGLLFVLEIFIKA